MGNCMSSKGTDQVVSCRLAEDCPPLIDIPGVNIDNPYNQSSKSPSRSGHSEDQTSEENRAASSSTDNPEWFHECIKLLNDIKATNDIDVLIPLIKKTLQKKKAMQQNNPVNDSTGSQEPQQMEEEESLWTSLTNKGSKFLNHIKDSVKKNWHEGIKTTAEILENVSKVNSVVGWLSIISYLLFTIGKGTDNQTECLNLLEDMIKLAEEVKTLENTIEEEKFKKAIKLIAEGSITCYSQLESQIFSRTINATVNSETLSSISSKINQLILDLTWTVVTNIDARIPGYVPPKPPLYPHWAGDCNIFGYPGSICSCSNASRRLEKVRFGFPFTEIGDRHTQLRNWCFKLKYDNQLAYLVFSINITGSSMPFLVLGS